MQSSGHLEFNSTVHGNLVSRDELLWNIKSITSLARYWASAIRISVAAKDKGVILEVLPGVSFFPQTVLVG